VTGQAGIIAGPMRNAGLPFGPAVRRIPHGRAAKDFARGPAPGSPSVMGEENTPQRKGAMQT
jgi:hypothetical protein